MANLTSQLILSLVDRATAPARAIARGVDDMRGRIERNNRQMDAMRGQLFGAAAAGVALYKGLQSPISAAVEFESAMADVRKVVDFPAPDGFARMSNDILEMSQRIPMAATDLAAIVSSAGQAGMAGDELLGFAEMAAQVGVAFDISADTAGESLAKIKTALGLTVPETSLLADAINHLSNTSASAAPDLLDFMSRVGATGKQYGFTEQQTVAIGSAMIAAGTASEVAATSFRNAGKALARGESATGRQVAAYRSLGLEAGDVAKRLQEDAVGTMEDVFERIRALPDHVRASTISELFGDEARGLMPLITNVDLLDNALGSVSDQAKYLGSSLKEYEVRAETTANAMQLFRNRVTGLGIAVGSALLPALNAVMDRLGPMVSRLADLAAANPVVTRMVIALTGGLVALRVAAIAARFSFLWLKGGMLVAALGSLQLTGALMSLLNPLKLVRAAMILLRTAFLFTGIGAVIAAIAAGGYWIYKNWANIGNAFDGFKKSFKKAMDPVGKQLEPVIEYFTELFEWVTGLFEPVEDVTGAFEDFGSRVGTSVGNAVRTVVDFFRDFPRSMAALPGQIRAWLSGIDWAGIGRQAIDLLKAGLAGAIKLISLRNDLFNWIADSIGEIDFGDLGTKWANLVVGGIQAGFGLIRDAFRALGTSEGRGELADALEGFLSSTGNLIGEIIKGLFNFGVAFWSTVWDKMFPEGTGEQLANKAKEVFQSLVDGAISKVDELIAWFKGLPGRIRDAIGKIEIGDLISWEGKPKTPPVMRNPSPEPGSLDILNNSHAIDGAKAAGGPIAAGRTYLVGEEGPELITPSRSGYVHDAATTARMGGGGRAGSTVGVTFAPGSIVVSGIGDPQAAADEILRRAGAMLRGDLAGVYADLEHAPGM